MMKAVQLSDKKGRATRNPVKLIIRFVQLLSLDISGVMKNFTYGITMIEY